MDFYSSSIPKEDLVQFDDYVVYSKNVLKQNKWFKGKLLIVEKDGEGVVVDKPILTFFVVNNSKDIEYVHKLYSQVTIKTLEEHNSFLRCGYQSLISKIYEDKTEQSGCPGNGPSGLICDMLL